MIAELSVAKPARHNLAGSQHSLDGYIVTSGAIENRSAGPIAGRKLKQTGVIAPLPLVAIQVAVV